jgi:putative nucleotidyltransferase with HDIG domain
MAGRPPRLLAKTLTATLVGVTLLLLIIFGAVSMSTRNQVRQNVTDTLEATQRAFAELEALRQREVQANVAILAENPTLKAAIDTFVAESATAQKGVRAQLLDTIERELEKLASHVEADAIVLVDDRQQTLAAVGPQAAEWTAGTRGAFSVSPSSAGASDGIVRTADQVYRSTWTPLTFDDAVIGALYVSTRLDDRYAKSLGSASSADIAILDNGNNGELLAGTLPPPMTRAFSRSVSAADTGDGTLDLLGEAFAYRRLVRFGDVSVYALGSIDRLALESTTAALRTVGLIAIGAGVLALVGSVWLAHSVTKPIGALSRALHELAMTRDLRSQLTPSGSSRELDALTETFNRLLAGVAAAEAQTEAAYTGAIRALAAALDARDPYTAGHSERVSVLSVAIGRTLQLPQADLEVLRLGALLHDIGKIGVPDAVLLKTGPLTHAEYDQIKQHPVLGARILRSVPFLAPHISIVELHHERPDGLGYPYGLQADATPLAARIVHAADAFDAMTSARAYRHARPVDAAIKELWRCAGTQFDAEIVEALALSLPGLGERAPRGVRDRDLVEAMRA